ncbi:DUF4214 domain-containing protein [Sulfurimonas sp. NWX367]|uniref:DUF4214 domain-containing protein n=1 Tax=unclassified Sulfurimonas TaxID=2623549 RepID=UPI00320496E6
MTTQELVDGLIYGDKWDKTTVSFSFKSSRLSYELAADYEGSVTVSEALKNAAFKIFDYIATLINLDFIYDASGVGDIVISEKNMSDSTTLGYAYTPYSNVKSPSGDIYISAAFNDEDFSYGGLGYSALMHEIGHALGLSHPFGDGFYPGVDIHDTDMSYNPYNGINTFTSYQAADIKALQTIYGVKEDTGDTLYDLNALLYSQKIYGNFQTTGNIATIYDFGGNDTISLESLSASGNEYIDINPGAQSIITNGQVKHYLALTEDTYIENIVGSQSSDTIVLNSLNNNVDAGNGYDTVYEEGITWVPRVDYFNNTIVVAGVDTGFDVLTNVEALYIDSVAVNLTAYQRSTVFYTQSSEAAIGRLYLAVLDRVADSAGLNYWVNNLNNGQSINDIANSFVLSAEFSSLYGVSQTNAEFINSLYENVLFRSADTDGLLYWEEAMNKGFTQADVVVGFSNSQEFIDLTGIYFQDNTMVVI